MGFHPLSSELCLFKNDKTQALLLLYVDDFCIAAPTQKEIQDTINILKSIFDIKSLGLVRHFLGFVITHNRDQRQIFLSQEQFMKKIIAAYNYDGYNSTKTPWPAGLQLPIEWEMNPEIMK